MKQMKSLVLLLLIYNVQSLIINSRNVEKRALQKSHEKPQWQKWADTFFGKEKFDQVPSLVQLLTKVSILYLSDCTPVILYDKFAESGDNLFLEQLFRNYPLTYIHGQITDNYTIKVKNVVKNIKTCISYILVMKDVMRCKDVIGDQHNSKVIAVARSSQWRVFEFLNNEVSHSFTNLLVVAKSERFVSDQEEQPYILFTHSLYTDALASSQAYVLTSWVKGRLTRPEVNLFPKKMVEGFAGHRFIISVAHQPPYVIRRGRDSNSDSEWDGIEIRLVNLLSKLFNFTTDFRETKDESSLGSSEAVVKQVYEGRANLGAAGLYTTKEKINQVGVSQWHSQDCASFISLTSTALPRYRAIMGPFHWTVWLALTMVYLLAIFPLAFSDKHTLRPLLRNPEEIENMFWYVFGTFTNCFSFTGKGSWSKAEKFTTRLLVGFYWLFTIIITACYTGSIIAFVTLPVYPAVVDTANQLLSGRYQIGTLNKGGWQYWFTNSTDKSSARLLKNIDLVPSIELGLKNTTKAFFWPYAFLASKAQLDYIVRTNFTSTNKRALLHISKECFVQFNVALVYPKNSIYQETLNQGVLLSIQAGLLSKLKSDVEWTTMRSATGKLLAANSNTAGLKALSVEDRALTLDDTQGMFLLLAIGFVAGGAALLSEWLGGCFHLCKRARRKNSTDSSITSNPRSHPSQTPRQKLDSVQYNSGLIINRLGSIIDIEFRRESTKENNDDNNDDDDCKENSVECIVHHNGDAENEDSDTDFEAEIDKIFENLFGEETSHEELKSDVDVIEDVENSPEKFVS